MAFASCKALTVLIQVYFFLSSQRQTVGCQLIQTLSAAGASGMPITRGTIDKGKNQEAIAFPFRPGESGVRISYKLPYAGNQGKLRFVSPYARRIIPQMALVEGKLGGKKASPASSGI